MVIGRPVFIVTDQADERLNLEGILVEAGHAVEVFHSPEIFFNRYSQDVMGCVILEPFSDKDRALMFQRELNEADWPLEIIFVAEPEDAGSAVTAMKQGAAEVLVAPVTRRQLLHSVQEISARNSQHHELLHRKTRARELMARLTLREVEVLTRIVEGQRTAEISRELEIRPRTVKAHRKSIREKLEARGTAEVVRIVVEASLKP